MEIAQTEYYKIVKSLGELRVCGIPSNDIGFSQFGMKITKIDENFEYGTHRFYQIELFVNGKNEDIKIGNKIISSIICSETEYIKKYNEFKNLISINYIDTYGSKLELNVTCELNPEYCKGKLLLYILYFIILISEVNNNELLYKLCQLIFDLEHYCGVGNSIETIKESQKIIQNIKDKYPFMSQKIDVSLDKRKKKIMADLYDAAILDPKNNEVSMK